MCDVKHMYIALVAPKPLHTIHTI